MIKKSKKDKFHEEKKVSPEEKYFGYEGFFFVKIVGGFSAQGSIFYSWLRMD